MAKRSASPDKLTIKGLSQDDQDWLKAESERLGCDPENLVRMMIRQRSSAIVVGYPPAPPPQRMARKTLPPQAMDYPAESVAFEDDALEPATQTINEADESLDALMSAGPPILDDSPLTTDISHGAGQGPDLLHHAPPPRRPAARFTPYDPIASQRSGRGMQFQRATNVFPYPRGGMDAFTETEFVGVNREVIGSNMMGDARGNVMRDNMKHFGVIGTRSSRHS